MSSTRSTKKINEQKAWEMYLTFGIDQNADHSLSKLSPPFLFSSSIGFSSTLSSK